MTITEKKVFALQQYHQEIKYLEQMSSKGKMLVAFDGDVYTFADSEIEWIYEVEFRIELDKQALIDAYMQEGYEYITTYTSSKGGTYAYFRRPKSVVMERKRNLEDRTQVLKLNVNRIERFTLVILVAVIGFYGYQYITNGNLLYLVIIGLALTMAGYVALQRRKMLNIIKELK
ncbi:DUF2812 domain-containing protein [Erysipelothrix sp. HDW6C]|uniref:DUF2812 domain-containing protein n=1 Tax=Erysipelothrix sp. HDW6C TaxID=2714930 RepID=UPI00140DB9D2|nr:DUF2812 domain-containing protein [Erysipelothrix sp. HDW6C]QIK69685.1 DUF2812 domain-containing protein [Erysipelothrix sp. HDW6C]